MADQVDERTPLIAVVHVAPVRRRYPHQTLRRLCTFLLSAVLLMAIIVALLVMFILPDCEDQRRSHHSHRPCIPKHPFFRDHNSSLSLLSKPKKGLTYPDLVKLLTEIPDEDKAREWSKYYTSGPHLGGKNLSQAEWTRDKWKEFGIEKSEIVAYDIYVNYPLGHRLALLEKRKSGHQEMKPFGNLDVSAWNVSYEAKLEEDVLKDDPTSALDDRVPTFHGYSSSGNVTAPFVFANYGTYQDFEDLISANVSLAGKIALVKYGRIFRGLKIRRAQQLGMIGVIIYTDPGDDGEVKVENGYKTYPEGPAREPSSVQRGSVHFLCK
jgi:N-acetylated-alpha-linked acidic dipeptidase